MQSHVDDENHPELFAFLWEKTKDFTFSEGKGESKNVSGEEFKKFRLVALVNFVLARGRWEFRRMPDAFRAVHTEADGAQEAFMILRS